MQFSALGRGDTAHYGPNTVAELSLMGYPRGVDTGRLKLLEEKRGVGFLS